MHTVSDELDHHPRVGQQGQYRSGSALVQRRHPVEQMGGHAGPGVDRGSGDIAITVGVAHRRHHPVVGQIANRGDRPRQFRGDGDHHHSAATGTNQRGDFVRIRGPEQIDVVGTALVTADPRTLQVDTRECPVIHQRREHCKLRQQISGGGCHQTRDQSGRAMPQVHVGAERSSARNHREEIPTPAAMTVLIDESWEQMSTTEIHTRCRCGTDTDLLDHTSRHSQPGIVDDVVGYHCSTVAQNHLVSRAIGWVGGHHHRRSLNVTTWLDGTEWASWRPPRTGRNSAVLAILLLGSPNVCSVANILVGGATYIGPMDMTLAQRLRVSFVLSLVLMLGVLLPLGSVALAAPPAPEPLGATATFASSDTAPRPNIYQNIMANATRPKYLDDMRAYSLRHYGINSYRLDPKAIVLHYTVSDAGSWQALINWWDQPSAVGSNTGAENPQPAAHFIIEQDGTIFQTMPTDIMVRNAYGLNHVAIGIEFVERSSATNVLRRPAQQAAGLALVRYLMSVHNIEAPNVLGHGTANSSPLFYDLTGARNDHTDWQAHEVAAFTAQLGNVPFVGRGPGFGSVTEVDTGVPNATVMGNATVVNPRAPGFTTVYPCAEGRPWASHNNYVTGQVVPNFALVRTDAAGKICIYTTSQTHAIWDQSGVLDGVTSHAAVRRLDTRDPAAVTGGARVNAAGTVKVPTGTPGRTVVANLTVTEPAWPGFTTAWTCGEPRPLASTNNYAPGQTTPNMAMVKADAEGNVCVFSSAPAHLIWDQVAETTTFAAQSPTRTFDSRTVGAGTRVPALAPVVVDQVAPFETVFGNLTVTDPIAAGHTVLYPCAGGHPATSHNNYVAGQITPNSAAVRADAEGKVCANSTKDAHLIWDRTGTVQNAGTHLPQRLLDTRG